MTSRWRASTRIAGAVLALSLACAPAAERTDEPSAGGGPTPVIEVSDAWARVLPDVGALYFTVHNHGSEPDRLIAVDAPAAHVMMHATIEDGDVVRMVGHATGFEVAAGGTLELKPGGKHVMLMEPLAEAAREGTISVTLHFERGGELSLVVPMKDQG